MAAMPAAADGGEAARKAARRVSSSAAGEAAGEFLKLPCTVGSAESGLDEEEEGGGEEEEKGKGGVVLESVFISGSVVSSSMFHLQE